MARPVKKLDPEVAKKYEEWGHPGDPIEGSKFYRGYCVGCGEPIRVILPKAPSSCDECMPDCDGDVIIRHDEVPNVVDGHGTGEDDSGCDQQSEWEIQEIPRSDYQYHGPNPWWNPHGD